MEAERKIGFGWPVTFANLITETEIVQITIQSLEEYHQREFQFAMWQQHMVRATMRTPAEDVDLKDIHGRGLDKVQKKNGYFLWGVEHLTFVLIQVPLRNYST